MKRGNLDKWIAAVRFDSGCCCLILLSLWRPHAAMALALRRFLSWLHQEPAFGSLEQAVRVAWAWVMIFFGDERMARLRFTRASTRHNASCTASMRSLWQSQLSRSMCARARTPTIPSRARSKTFSFLSRRFILTQRL